MGLTRFGNNEFTEMVFESTEMLHEYTEMQLACCKHFRRGNLKLFLNQNGLSNKHQGTKKTVDFNNLGSEIFHRKFSKREIFFTF